MAERQIIVPACFPDGFKPTRYSFETPHRDQCDVPPTIREVGIDRVLNRKVLGASCHLGTYGMGGAGLTGFGLEPKDDFPEETLVLCIWGSNNWLHWDNKYISDSMTHGQEWDKDTDKQHGHSKFEKEVTDTILTSFELGDGHARLTFDDHVLEFRESNDRQPHGNGSKRAWRSEDDSLWDAWFVARSANLLV